MGRARQVERAVEHVVALRRVSESVADDRNRRRLEKLERELRGEIGVGVPKRRAAALLGVTVPALERWIERGRLPVARRPGSSREEIDADALVELAVEVNRMRENGQTRGVLAVAFGRLAERGLPLPKLRPNESAYELRRNYLRTTPLDRLREVAELSRALTGIAARRARTPTR